MACPSPSRQPDLASLCKFHGKFHGNTTRGETCCGLRHTNPGEYSTPGAANVGKKGGASELFWEAASYFRVLLISLLISETCLTQICRSRCSMARMSSMDQWKWYGHQWLEQNQDD